MDIKIGAPVRAEDGQAGTVERIILHPDTRELDGVVARLAGMPTRDVVVPVDRIVSADVDGILLVGSTEDVANLDAFALNQYTTPPEEWLPLDGEASEVYLLPASPLTVGAFTQPASHPDPPAHEVEDLEAGDVDVSGSTTVFCTDGVAGKVDRVITEGDTDVVTHLIVHRGAVGARDVAVPVSDVAALGGDGIRLTLTRDELDELPGFDEE